MPSVSEIPADADQLQGALRQSLDNLDLDESVTFQAYTRTVLPVDGYVFWSPSATLTVEGSLHYSQEIQVAAEETVGFATVILTSKDKIEEFSKSDGSTLYVASVGNFRYAFSQQNGFYTQAGLWHYFGHSLYPALETQLLDAGNTIDQTRAVVSNSLPFWLDLASYTPVYAGLSNSTPVYPAYLVEENIAAPYVVADIQRTDPIQSVPLRGPFGPHTQLMQDRVVLTLYGFQNNEALDFLDTINQYSLDTDNFGIMDPEALFDARRVQTELQGIGMKKTLELNVSYYQSRSTALAQQLITAATPTFILGAQVAA